MLRWLVIGIIIFALVKIFIIDHQDKEAVIYDIDGRPVQLAALANKWVIVNYWAPWCEPCKEEIPELNRFYQDKDQDVILYGVDIDPVDHDELRIAAKKMNVLFPLLGQNPASAWGLTGLGVIPTTYILNPDGKVVDKIVGGTTEKSLLETLHGLQGS